MKKIPIVGVQVDVTSYPSAVSVVLDWVRGHESCYICIANVHMLMEAYDSVAFREEINSSDLVVPDGMPLVWLMRLKGQRYQQRVYGPTLMLKVLEAASRENIPVGFYGGKPEVLNMLVEKIKARYASLNVAYSFSPPFGNIGTEEDVIVEQINRSGVRILFVGLGCPKQEKWMANHRGTVHAVMLGVGAAFDFHAGVKPQAPAWMQKIGMEWLFRLVSEPTRLWRRYLYHNPRFVILAILDLLRS